MFLLVVNLTLLAAGQFMEPSSIVLILAPLFLPIAKSMGIDPLGSTVLLTNATIARVIETRPEAPLRPKLRVIVDEYGKRFESDDGDAVDLAAEKTLFIARALDPKELARA